MRDDNSRPAFPVDLIPAALTDAGDFWQRSEPAPGLLRRRGFATVRFEWTSRTMGKGRRRWEESLRFRLSSDQGSASTRSGSGVSAVPAASTSPNSDILTLLRFAPPFLFSQWRSEGFALKTFHDATGKRGCIILVRSQIGILYTLSGITWNGP